jgi:imidazolonepropionase-like amidohydrolase/dienelactone hydrolase
MKTKIILVTFLLCFIAGAGISRDQATSNDARPAVVAFVNVNIVPMDKERVLENQTVIVRDGRIAEIGPAAQIKVPSGATQVDGKGKYLMPGLAEMHGHLPHPNQGEAVANSFLTLFVANGITTVRGMFGFPNHPALRERIAKGEVFGPRLVVASPALSGQSVQTVEQAEQLVRQYKKDGFDLLKVHEGLSVASYDRIVTTANEVGIPFAGHVANDVGLERALKAKQASIEHLDGYLEAVDLEKPYEDRIKQLAITTRAAGSWVTPTMALWQTFHGGETGEALRKERPEVKYVPQQMVNQWESQRENQLANINAETGRRVIEFRGKLLKTLADSGVKILLGSDAPQLFSVPGFSLQREMEAMVRAGLTPYQVLESGTRNPAIYLNAEKTSGTIEVGKIADLILVNGNPLADITNVAKRSGVMLRGRWLPESELAKMLDAIAASYQPASQTGSTSPPPAGVQKNQVNIKAPDGISLKGTLYSSNKPGSGVILSHMCDGNGREAWDGLATRLAQNGFHVLTWNYRGVGDSEGERFQGGNLQQVLEYWRTKWGGDAEAALNFLQVQPGVNKAAIGAGGASCGVFMSLLLAQLHPEQVKTLVLLGGPYDAGLKSFVENHEALSLLGVTSEDDQRTTNWTREIVTASKNPASKLVLYQNAGHGTQMFQKEKDLEPMILEWFKTTLQR